MDEQQDNAEKQDTAPADKGQTTAEGVAVYIAAGGHPLTAEAVARHLRDCGHEILSRWHEQGIQTTDQGAGESARLERLERAHSVVVIGPTDNLPSLTALEVGWAMARRKTVLSLGQVKITDVMTQSVMADGNSPWTNLCPMCVGLFELDTALRQFAR